MAEAGGQRFLLPTHAQSASARGGSGGAAPGAGSLSPNDRVYYNAGGGRRVPSTVRELRALVATGGIKDCVLVWAPQLRDWTTLKAAAPLLGQLGRGQEEDDAARLLQSRWRGHSARRHACQEDGAARLMQARWRGHHARHALQQEERAALVMQSQWRGHQTRHSQRAAAGWPGSDEPRG